MLIPTRKLLAHARRDTYAVGAFNVYNLEGALAVTQAAEELKSPVILQVLPSALEIGGKTLVKLCLEAGKSAAVPVSVHLDHCSSPDLMHLALSAGVSSVMADGSMHDQDTNIRFTRQMVQLAETFTADVDAELVAIMKQGIDAMKEPVKEKIRLFGAVNKAEHHPN